MSFDKPTRATLEKMVSAAREHLKSDITEQLQSDFRMQPDGTALPLTGLTEDQRVQAEDLRELLDHFAESQVGTEKDRRAAAYDRLVREIGFTILNRLAALRLCEERGLVQECVRNGMASEGFRVFDSLTGGALGTRYTTYRIFLEDLFDELALDLGALFDRHSPLSHVFPSERALEDVLTLLNDPALAHLWREDETIGWIYQYYNDAEERRKMRESQAPRNSRELAVRNQFFTPRYVVEFLTDNTLGRIWYEMRHGDTRLTANCRYLVRRKHSIFLKSGEKPPEPFVPTDEWGDPDGTGEMWVRPNPELHELRDIWHYALSVGGYHYAKEHLGIECAELANPKLEKYQQTHKWEGTFEELRCCLFNEQRRWRHFGYDPEGEDLTAILELHKAICERWDWEVDIVPFREEKDPRKILMLDPAGGSGHFGLYCFDLFETIYAEAYDDPELGPALQADYPDQASLLRQVPAMILANNIHIIDIDQRACQIAALALWLRAQRSFQQMGLKPNDRPQIKVNVVCAEPMPGERALLDEFIAELRPRVLADLVRIVFEKMKLAGEAGSLLKIEEELQDAISDAKRQWLQSDKAEQLLLSEEFAKPQEPEQLGLFDTSGISDEKFWDQAEARVLDALRAYAEHAINGRAVRRELFVDDAKQGFALIDLCHKKYDVMLMNPPFGNPSIEGKTYAIEKYGDCKEDIDAAFVRRGVDLLTSSGRLGVIANRTQFFKPTLREWREDVLLTRTKLEVCADLGYGVLDDALVEAATYVLSKTPPTANTASFFRLLKTSDKADALQQLVYEERAGTSNSSESFQISPSVFITIPESRISYWASEAIRKALLSLPRFEGNTGTAKQGLSTADDFRFLRLAWEVPSSNLVTNGIIAEGAATGKHCWVPVAKGGEYDPYFQDLHLVLDWTGNGSSIRTFPGAAIRNPSYYFQAGITYSERTASGFSPRILPVGCIFTQIGPLMAVYSRSLILPLLGILMSRPVAAIIETMVESGDAVRSGSAARHYTQNVVGSIPIPPIEEQDIGTLSRLVEAVWRIKQIQDARLETGRHFLSPDLGSQPERRSRTLEKWISANIERSERQDLEILEHSWNVENMSRRLYQLDSVSTKAIDSEMGPHPWSFPVSQNIDDNRFCESYLNPIGEIIRQVVSDSGGSRSITKKGYYANRRLELLCAILQTHPSVIVSTRQRLGLCAIDDKVEQTALLISYCLGCAFGRWDIRIALDPTLAPGLQDAFGPLPVCPPGMLVGTDGLPATPHDFVSQEWLRVRPNAVTLPPEGAVQHPTISEAEYPVGIAWDGILVDDSGFEHQAEHASGIVRRLREVLAVLWSDSAEAIEAEACEILGVHDLRDYVRSPSGFFADHLKSYSKSRRQAPIYWPLSTASGSYTVWVYYHRLTKDTLYTIVTQYVNPKIESVQKRVDQLGEKLETSSGKTATDLRDQLSDTKQFLSELNDFRAELLRVAELPYKPDLNDGVIINAAPLNKLFRLRKWANDTAAIWKKLEAGEYDWAHMAYNIWPKRVEKKCETDRSIAIAHGLEHLGRAEVKKTKKATKRKEEDEDEEND